MSEGFEASPLMPRSSGAWTSRCRGGANRVPSKGLAYVRLTHSHATYATCVHVRKLLRPDDGETFCRELECEPSPVAWCDTQMPIDLRRCTHASRVQVAYTRATLRNMRSMEESPHESRGERQALARRVGEYLTDAATAAGYDVRPRAGGRAQLATSIGVSLTTISRTLEGKTLPLPSQLTAWASVLGLDQREMLVNSGMLPPEHGPQPPARRVASVTLTPEEAMDAWGITDLRIRTMLSGNIVQAIELQKDLDADDSRGATARG